MKPIKSYKELEDIIGKDKLDSIKELFKELNRDAEIEDILDEVNFVPDTEAAIFDRGENRKMVYIKSPTGNYCVIPIFK